MLNKMIATSLDEFIARFFGGYRIVDEYSGFELDYTGLKGFNQDEVIAAKAADIERAMENLSLIESGGIANPTEGRQVDHYSLRMGEGLKESLRLWKKISTDIAYIMEGLNGLLTATRNEKGEGYTDVIINGIGGSFLGPIMLLIAKLGRDYNFRKLGIRVHYVNNTDPDGFDRVVSKLDLSKTIMIDISKSGGTWETAGNMEAFNQLVSNAGLQIGRHNIAVTTPGSPFDKFANENKFMHIYHMNDSTGGRTSIWSAVGMVPAAFAGIDFEAFLLGASHMDELTRNPDPRKNPALILALAINDVIERLGHKNIIYLGYSDFLAEFAHYLQQLFMESLGKEHNLQGSVVNAGQTVFGGVGTGEQHAFMQQVQKGINDAITAFVSFRKRNHDFANTNAGTMGRQQVAFVQGTQEALRSNNRGYYSITLEGNDEFNMGMLVALQERIVSYLAALWNINAYDQPGVQDGKNAAKGYTALTKKVVEKLLTGVEFTGTALEFARKYGFSVKEAANIERILLDIATNKSKSYREIINTSINYAWNGRAYDFRIMPNTQVVEDGNREGNPSKVESATGGGGTDRDSKDDRRNRSPRVAMSQDEGED